MLLPSDAKQILEFVDLEDVEPEFLASVDLRIEMANSDLLLCSKVVDRNFDDVFAAAIDVGQDRRVCFREGFWLETGRGAQSTDFARVSCVETAGVKVVQRFKQLVAPVTKARVEDGLALVLNVWRATNDLFRLFTTR